MKTKFIIVAVVTVGLVLVLRARYLQSTKLITLEGVDKSINSATFDDNGTKIVFNYSDGAGMPLQNKIGRPQMIIEAQNTDKTKDSWTFRLMGNNGNVYQQYNI